MLDMSILNSARSIHWVNFIQNIKAVFVNRFTVALFLGPFETSKKKDLVLNGPGNKANFTVDGGLIWHSNDYVIYVTLLAHHCILCSFQPPLVVCWAVFCHAFGQFYNSLVQYKYSQRKCGCLYLFLVKVHSLCLSTACGHHKKGYVWFIPCSLSCSILLASLVWPTVGSFKAFTSLFQVGTPAMSTWSTFCSHSASMSCRKVGVSINALRRL